MLKDIQFELEIVKASSTVNSGDRIVCGYASTYDVDSDDMQITRTALEKAKDDLLKYSTVLFNHDSNRPIGKVVETSTDDIGLFVKIVLSKTEDDVWNKITEGIINKFSIKGRASMPCVSGHSELMQVNDIELFEVSLVSVPANVEAQTICYYIAKSLNDTQESSNKKDMLKEKLNELLTKEDAVLREGIKSIISDIDKGYKDIEDLVMKLQVVSGKLLNEDKDTVEKIVSILKDSNGEYYYFEKPCDEDETKALNDEEIDGLVEKLEKSISNVSDENDKNAINETIEFLKKKKTAVVNDDTLTKKSFNFSDESDERPVFQLRSNDIIREEEGSVNRFRKQILKFGKWYHWCADGGILNINNKTIDSLVKNFNEKTIENVSVPLTHTDDPSKNTGEIVSLEKTKDGLDAVIEIKDENIAEKIRKGLIKCISASFDPNYKVKKTNAFVGPTLLHAALVAEPYIKGMGSFIPLADEFANRQIIQLEDEEPNLDSLYKSINETMDEIKKNMITEDKVTELFYDLAKKKLTPAEGDNCTTDSGEKGKMTMDGDKLVCKALSKSELDGIAKSAYKDCVAEEIKGGKTAEEAMKVCKVKVKKDFDLEVSEEEPEIKTTEEASKEESTEVKPGDGSEETPIIQNTSVDVDLADVEKTYEKYLKEGKIVPSQKEAFVKLCQAQKVYELSENKVELTKSFEQFMNGLPKIVNFDENGSQGGDPVKTEEAKIAEGAMPEEVKNFFGKMGLTDEGANESWKFAQDLKKEEEENKSTLF